MAGLVDLTTLRAGSAIISTAASPENARAAPNG